MAQASPRHLYRVRPRRSSQGAHHSALLLHARSSFTRRSAAKTSLLMAMGSLIPLTTKWSHAPRLGFQSSTTAYSVQRKHTDFRFYFRRSSSKQAAAISLGQSCTCPTSTETVMTSIPFVGWRFIFAQTQTCMTGVRRKASLVDRCHCTPSKMPRRSQGSRQPDGRGRFFQHLRRNRRARLNVGLAAASGKRPSVARRTATKVFTILR